MARIPQLDDAQVPKVAGSRPLVNVNASALAAPAQGLQRLAQAGEQAATLMSEKQRQADEYAAMSRFTDFDLAQQKAFDEAQRSASENPRGFADTFGQQYNEAAKAFAEGLSPGLRPKFDMMLKRRGGQYAQNARNFEERATDLYHENDLSTRLTDLQTLGAQRPDAYRENVARGIVLIDSAPIPAAAKMKLRTKFAQEAELFALRGKDAELTRRAKNPDITTEEFEAIQAERDRIWEGLHGGPRPLDDMANPETRAKPFDAGDVAPAGPRRAVSAFSPEVNNAINAAAQKHGVDPGILQTFARIESGGRPNAQTGSYRGLFQLSSSEFAKHGGRGDIYDATANADAAAAKLKAEAAEFQAKYGRAATPADLYLIHQQGEAGYENHTSNPGAPAWQNMAATGEGKQKGAGWAKQAIWGNIPDDMKRRFGSVENVTSQQFMDLWREKVERFGGGSAPSEPEYAGEYRYLSPDQRLDMMRVFESSKKSSLEGYREILKRKLDDDVESIRKTGVSSNPDLGMAKRVLEPNQVHTYALERQEAEMEYKALNGLASMTYAEIENKLSDDPERGGIRPKAGEENFAMKAKVYDKLVRAVDSDDGVRTLREKDPARSVEEIPEVKQATQFARENPDDPDAIASLSKARLDAQEKVGVPKGLQSAITKAEARVLAAPLRGLEGKDLREKSGAWMSEIQAKYGVYAPSVAREVIRKAISQDKDLADEVASQISKIAKGEQPTAADVRRLQFLQELNQAAQAFGGDFVGSPMQQFGTNSRMTPQPLPDDAMPLQVLGMRQPPQTAIDFLIKNPATAMYFDQTYGRGMSAQYLIPEGATGSKSEKK